MTARHLSLGAVAVVCILVASSGCGSSDRTSGPSAPGTGTVVTGVLVSLKDDRPVDGGIDLTIETDPGGRELVRVPSIFLTGPRDSVAAMHAVVDAAKPGDRIRARGTRDEDGALRAEVLEKLAF